MNVMTILYRSGGLLSVEDLSNDNSAWFDSVSQDWLTMGDGERFVPRSSAVFATLTIDDVFMWAERRVMTGQDATIYEIDIPDDIELQAYKYKHYDDAHRAFDEPNYWGSNVTNFQWFVNAYWCSGVEVNHWSRMWMKCMEDYNNSQEWEVLIPAKVAEHSNWKVLMEHPDVFADVNVPEDWDYSM